MLVLQVNDLWLAKDNRFLNPMSSYERIMMGRISTFCYENISKGSRIHGLLIYDGLLLAVDC